VRTEGIKDSSSEILHMDFQCKKEEEEYNTSLQEADISLSGSLGEKKVD